mmetsp:Transcript_12507/g.37737  ORF Transcript_12507/g.37737 Transcript_12507/m.37737 type:complete len:96 (-) Transcript_12507:44-331(-)
MTPRGTSEEAAAVVVVISVVVRAAAVVAVVVNLPQRLVDWTDRPRGERAGTSATRNKQAEQRPGTTTNNGAMMKKMRYAYGPSAAERTNERGAQI